MICSLNKHAMLNMEVTFYDFDIYVAVNLFLTIIYNEPIKTEKTKFYFVTFGFIFASWSD